MPETAEPPVASRVVKVFREHQRLRGLDPGEVTQQSRLPEDLDFDSIDLLELVLDLEEEFGIEIPDETEWWPTVGDAVRWIELRAAAAAPPAGS